VEPVGARVGDRVRDGDEVDAGDLGANLHARRRAGLGDGGATYSAQSIDVPEKRLAAADRAQFGLPAVRVHLADRVALGADRRRLANGLDGRASDVDAGTDGGLRELVEFAIDPRERVRGEELRAIAGDEVARGGPDWPGRPRSLRESRRRRGGRRSRPVGVGRAAEAGRDEERGAGTRLRSPSLRHLRVRFRLRSFHRRQRAVARPSDALGVVRVVDPGIGALDVTVWEVGRIVVVEDERVRERVRVGDARGRGSRPTPAIRSAAGPEKTVADERRDGDHGGRGQRRLDARIASIGPMLVTGLEGPITTGSARASRTTAVGSASAAPLGTPRPRRGVRAARDPVLLEVDRLARLGVGSASRPIVGHREEVDVEVEGVREGSDRLRERVPLVEQARAREGGPRGRGRRSP